MILREPLVAAPVVAGDARHDLLLLIGAGALGLQQEVRGRRSPQRRRRVAAMMHEDLAAFRRAS